MRAIIYCRVSTERQVKKGLSLEEQRKQCVEFAQRQGWEVAHVFMEKGESATSLDRTELKKLTEYCQKYRGKVDVMIVHAIDRFARETLDHKMLRAYLMTFGVTLRSVTQPAVDDSPEGELFETILSGMAQYDNKLRARRTITGMKGKIERGGWPFKAPLGFRHAEDEGGRRVIVQDAERAPLIKAAFEMYASGTHKKLDVLRHVTALGLRNWNGNPVPIQTFDRMLKNPCYAGILKVNGVKVKDWNDCDQASFAPIVSRDTFTRVQDVLENRAISVSPRNRNNPDFPLRGFVRCGFCNRPMTASWNRGRNGTRYPNYHCQNRKCSGKETGQRHTFNRDRFESEFIDFLRRLQPSDDHMKLFRAVILDVWSKRQADAFDNIGILEKRIAELRERRKKLNEARYLATVPMDQNDYLEFKAQIESEMLEAERELKDAKGVELDTDALLSFIETLMPNAARLWERMMLDQKQRFQQVLFPEGVEYRDGSYRTTTTCLLFNILEASNEEKERLVALPGIEPGFED